jgi:cobalt/nickel transport system permease protein
MHIPEGYLTLPAIAGGYAITAAATWYSIRKIKKRENPREDVPKASLLTAAFFMASLISIPLPIGSVHLVLNGLLGAVLGYFALPAILIGLFFQAVMFGHGGLTTLGVNAVVMGLPAIVSFYIFRLRKIGKSEGRLKIGIYGFLAGAIAIAISLALYVGVAVSFISADLSETGQRTAIYSLVITNLPLLAIEGIITAMLAVFLHRVRPQILDGV